MLNVTFLLYDFFVFFNALLKHNKSTDVLIAITLPHIFDFVTFKISENMLQLLQLSNWVSIHVEH